MTILGIDVSTRAVDLVYLNVDTLRGDWQRIDLPNRQWAPSERRWQQIGAITDTFPTRTQLENRGVTLAAIEDPHGRHAHTAKALGEITGAAKALLHDRRIHALAIPPAEWKRELGLGGNASKDDVAAVIRDIGSTLGIPGVTAWPQDAYDAWAIAIAALRITERAAA